MIKLLFSLISLYILVLSPYQATADQVNQGLPECVVLTHCVLEKWPVTNPEESFNKVVEAVSRTPRTTIVEQSKFFIHAEAKTKWRRYTDDLLVMLLPKEGVIQVRSESRVGIGDNGVNRKRVEDLSYRLTTNQF